MTSTIETGHDKNVSSLERLISECINIGAAYAPANTTLKVTSLQTLLTNSKNSLQALKTAEINFKNVTNEREIAFEPLKKLSTKIINALDSTEASKQTVSDAKTINNKIQGKRAKAIKDVAAAEISEKAETPKKQISVSQQSYDSLIEHFAKLITLVSSISYYTPNESELKVQSLNNKITQLKNLNSAVITAETNYKSQLANRNKLLYHPETGLLEIASNVKKYLKSLLGTTSPQYKLVSKIPFRACKI